MLTTTLSIYASSKESQSPSTDPGTKSGRGSGSFPGNTSGRLWVSLAGPAGSGKTAAAQYLNAKRKGLQLSFAAALKQRALNLGWDGSKDLSGRKLLQGLGLLVREYDEDFWIDRLKEQLDFSQHMYIDDMRFMNELLFLKGRKFHTVYLLPHGLRMNEEWRDHPSEREIHPEFCDTILRSEIGDLGSLYDSLDALVERLEEDALPK